MMLPSVLVDAFEELEVPLRSASSLAMNEEMIDCADVVPDATEVSSAVDVVPAVVAADAAVAAVLALRLLTRLWNADDRLDVMEEVSDVPDNPDNNSLSPAAAARDTSAAAV
jgi:hypothetical protein